MIHLRDGFLEITDAAGRPRAVVRDRDGEPVCILCHPDGTLAGGVVFDSVSGRLVVSVEQRGGGPTLAVSIVDGMAFVSCVDDSGQVIRSEPLGTVPEDISGKLFIPHPN